MAGLRHPALTLVGLRRQDLATLQVLQVLCALRGRAGRGVTSGAGYAPTPAYDLWRRRPVADRYAALLRA